MKMLAPDPWLLEYWKRYGDWDVYVQSYNDMLQKLDPYAVARTLPDNAVLLCYERDPTHCHRSLVAAWLTEHGYPTIEIKEES